MRKTNLSCLAILILFLVSCQKESSFEVALAGNGNNGIGPLKKIMTKIGNDSFEVKFGYDAKDRYLSSKSTYPFVVLSFDNAEERFVRNSGGIIEKVIDFGYRAAMQSKDSLEYTVHYDAVKKRYTSMIAIIDADFAEKDSVAYTYDASGKVIMAESFYTNKQMGGYQEYIKFDYHYINGSVSKVTLSEYDPAEDEYLAVYDYSFEYDNKTSPLALSYEAFLVNKPALFSTRNLTKLTEVYYDGNGEDDVTTISYTYNSSGKPSKATMTSQALSGFALPVDFIYN